MVITITALSVCFMLLMRYSNSPKNINFSKSHRSVISWQKASTKFSFLPLASEPSHNGTHSPKMILMYNIPTWLPLVPGAHHFLKCNSSCVLTIDTELTSMADCVVFYSQYARFKGNAPPPRQWNSVWVFFASESPVHLYTKAFADPAWRNQFNWTMTYRRDSDFYCGNGDFIRRPFPVMVADILPTWDTKTKMAAWFVSNCKTQSKRDTLVNILKRYISVDVYGQCGDHICKPHRSQHCRDLLTNDYYFYLSFENSLCVDYMTEKVYETMMQADVIPVVFGGANYTKLLPQHSFIDVSTFSSIQDLSVYLKNVASDRELYQSYFLWRREWSVFAQRVIPFCDMCYRVHYQSSWARVYEDIHTWWMKNTCHSPSFTDH